MLDLSSEVLHLHYQNIRTICTANVLDILETLTLKRNVSAEFIMLMAEITTLEIQPIVVNALSRCRANMKEAFPRSWLLFLDNHNSTLFANILTCHHTSLILHVLIVLKLVVLHNYVHPTFMYTCLHCPWNLKLNSRSWLCLSITLKS